MSNKKKCSVVDCDNKYSAKGYCIIHYNQIYRNKPLTSIKKRKRKEKICSVDDCGEKHYAKGLCSYHYYHEYNSESNPERFEYLKSVRSKYSKTEKGKQSIKKYFRSEKGRQVIKSATGRRRARKKGSGAVENFTHLQVFQRDFFTCAICGLPVPVNEKHPSRLSASLDHFLALSKGGSHSLDNVNCTHWICNVTKNARILELSFEGANI